MTALSDAMKPYAARLTRRTTRNCALCGVTFEATGFVGLCEACEPAQAKPKPIVPRELGESWPLRHRENLATMHGPGAAKAAELLPRILAGAMLVLAGDRGRGKTQLATWLAWQRGQAGLPCGRYAKAFDLFSAVKATFCKSSEASERDILEGYKSVPFLALDECHERGETDWENRTLRNVLDHRYDRCLPTVIIGNWRTNEEIAACLGASIVDRVTETGGLAWCRWESYRAGGVA